MSKDTDIRRQIRMDLLKVRNKVVKHFEVEINGLVDKYAECEIMREKEGILPFDKKTEPDFKVDDTIQKGETKS